MQRKTIISNIGNKINLNFWSFFIRILVLTINIDYDNVLPQYNSNVTHSDAWDYWKIFHKVNDGEIYSSFKILFILRSKKVETSWTSL